MAMITSSFSEQVTTATGWRNQLAVNIHAASCGCGLLKCESGGAALRYDFRRRKFGYI
ncbi:MULTISPECIES: hypothetical protein [Mesorhizobium]|uniref:hypothetical protein n=1 Tax=Mesorhizobium TaxID=68287 RepID=UPI001428C09F|nr:MULTISPECIES: hypothetical protein [Mesorhizobium]MCF6102946.1 hypothetical protein [Mesorhizobium muleiense]MCF6119552.1 hypothetical protein [Mesorhizobium muleiense]